MKLTACVLHVMLLRRRANQTMLSVAPKIYILFPCSCAHPEGPLLHWCRFHPCRLTVCYDLDATAVYPLQVVEVEIGKAGAAWLLQQCVLKPVPSTCDINPATRFQNLSSILQERQPTGVAMASN